MFRHLIIFSVLLNLKPAVGSSNVTVAKPDSWIMPFYSNGTQPLIMISRTFDDVGSAKIQQQIDLLTSANENLRLRLELNNERMARHLTDILNEFKSRSGSNETNSHLNGLANEINSRINGLANVTNNRPNRLANETNESFKLPGKNCTNSGEQKIKKEAYPTSCLKSAGGLQQIQIDGFCPDPFFVYCDNGWTVIQRRMDGSVDFNRNWTEYKQGFGNLAGEFFIGLEKLHALTNTSSNELLIVMRDKEYIERFAKYDAFAISSENEQYALKEVGKYSGDAGDSLIRQRSGRFYTIDNDHPKNCSMRYGGAWWDDDDKCRSSLNGKYGNDTNGMGITWKTWHHYNYSLPYAKMMIRPKTSLYANTQNTSNPTTQPTTNPTQNTSNQTLNIKHIIK